MKPWESVQQSAYIFVVYGSANHTDRRRWSLSGVSGVAIEGRGPAEGEIAKTTRRRRPSLSIAFLCGRERVYTQRKRPQRGLGEETLWAIKTSSIIGSSRNLWDWALDIVYCWVDYVALVTLAGNSG